MPKYTVLHGSFIASLNGNRVTKSVGDEVELTEAEAKHLDPEGVTLGPVGSTDFLKGPPRGWSDKAEKAPAPKAPAAPVEPKHSEPAPKAAK
jgi:hypothetical protein